MKNKNKSGLLNKILAVFVIFSLSGQSVASAQAPQQQDKQRIGYNDATGKVSFIGADPSRPIAIRGAQTQGLQPDSRALAMVSAYATDFGLRNPVSELKLLETEQVDGREVTRFQQVHQGIPIMGGEIIVNANDRAELLSLSGEISPDLALDVNPTISAKQAQITALELMAKSYQVSMDEFEATAPALWIYDSRLFEPDGTKATLVWRLEVKSKGNSLPVNELVLVDAKRGNIVLNFNQIDTSWTSTGNETDGNPAPSTQDSAPTETPTETPEPETAEPVTPEPGILASLTPSSTKQSPADETLRDQQQSLGVNYYVDIATGNDANSCTSTAAPCQHIQNAISKAGAGDIIKITSGTYLFSANPTPNVVIIPKNLTLSGGWTPAFDVQSGVSIIDGQNTKNGILVNGTYTVLVENFIIQNAISSGNGGAIYISDGNFTLQNSTLKNNTASGHGGGIYGGGGTITVINSTISGNTAASGGGIRLENTAIAVIRNSTIAYNIATGNIGGISPSNGSVNLITMTNSILALNISQSTSFWPDCIRINTSSYNIIGNTQNCTVTAGAGDQFNVNPQINSALTGVNQTHALLSSSPAINAGTSTGCPVTDQRGVARAGACDIGAFEYTPAGPAASISVFSGNGQRSSPNLAFINDLQVLVLDNLGSPVSGVSVTFTAPASGASGIFQNTSSNISTVTTNINGIAASSIFTANSTPGAYTVSASTDGVGSTADFSLQNVAWFVSTIGNDSNSCSTSASPCLTIQAAVNKAVSGDLIYVTEGVYENTSCTGGSCWVLQINKSLTLSGGWNSSFTSQVGYSKIDGSANKRGVNISSATVNMNRFFIQNSYSQYATGGLGVGGSTLRLSESAIINNNASEGDGINATNSAITLVNVTITQTQNNAIPHEGISISGGSITLINSTISNNGGTGLDLSNYTTVTIRNSIIANNGSDCKGYLIGEIATFDHSLIESNTSCGYIPASGNLNGVDPGAMTFYPTGGYYSLISGSPAINAGDNAHCPVIDQRGLPRPNGQCDMGAVESQASNLAPASITLLGNLIRHTRPGDAFANSFQAYLADSNGDPIANSAVTFDVPSSGASGIFATSGTNSVTVNTNNDGIATASLTGNLTAGAYLLTVTAGSAPSASYSLANIIYYVGPAGNDSNSCDQTSSPCLTINGALGKSLAGDYIYVADGTYTSMTDPMVTIDKNINIYGGWNASFTAQSGQSKLDAQNNKRVLLIADGVVIELDHFDMTNGTSNGLGGSGGIFNNGSLSLSNSSIYHNHGINGSGAGIVTNGPLFLSNVTISNNMADSDGAGINVKLGPVHINNSTIYQNVSLPQGQTVTYGGGVSNRAGAAITISNSIVAGNVSSVDPDCSGPINSDGYNLIGYADSCSISATVGDLIGTSPINAKLGNLSDNGGNTLTHALLSGSPAINAGNPATCETTDQRGIARPQGLACDMGAFEGSEVQIVSGIVLTYSLNHATVLPGTFLCDQTSPNCTSGTNVDADQAHKFALEVYQFYINRHDRQSIDGNNMPIISSVLYGSAYDNAFWDGAQIVYGDGYPLADDVVGHELTHGVTQYESNLFYYYQSGAINESFSDVWGELYDQQNGLGNDAPSVKWLLAEDLAGGANRSMINPPVYGDPDKMTSANYFTAATDNGGVHTNSGINNKAAFLMVDGGSFNGKTITALGANKTLAIYYEVQTNLLTSGADYSDLYYSLYQGCLNLVGGTAGIVSGDCDQVRNATDAVEMNLQPVANFNTDAPMCGVGLAPNNTFYDDLESGASNWTMSYSRWQYDSPYGDFAHSGTHFLYADDYPAVVTDTYIKLKPITIPSNGYLHFSHAYDFEKYTNDPNYYDGGILEYSINNGASWVDAKSLIDYNGYKGNIYSNWNNPLKGRSAFVGSSHGYISTRVNLSSLVGKTVNFRWRMGLDDNGSRWGWWLDDVRIYNCMEANPNVNISINGVSMGSYNIADQTARRFTYAGFSGGPVRVVNTESQPVVSSLRLLYNNKTFSELMGVPTSQLSNDYWLPYYANISGTDTQIRFTNTDDTLSTTVNVYLGDNPTPVYTNTLLPETTDRINLPSGTTGGPVHIVGTGGINILAGMRVIYGGNKSFDELMAFPTAQLDTEYWFPFYNHNNVNLDTQVRVANTSSTNSAPVNIYIGDTLMDTTTIAPLSAYLKSFPGVNGGPVRVVSTSGTPVPIVASLRLLYNNKTFSELMGVPTSQLSNDYWLPYYANIPGTDTQLRFTNTDPTLSTTVNIYLGNNPTPVYTKTLLPKTADRINLPSGTTGGPVHIVGTGGVNILAGMRVIYGGNSSFDELSAYPDALLSAEYWFPFYNHNNVNLDTEARIGVP